ncbi:sugar ABC transporter ATP-binding protein [Streptomyces sp. DSM 110735]|uniref:sugar ABC transporter ATP-binding protein n=1 Tax=Streptomyces sp. DSM 110735 TaxID=2775031 RepID=UPI0018F51B74|nr:sugar ABC transporter ATP-binding protein [Streptomyces sp. DSM 110735]MBJ7902468.1 sugar ABC transporter ATP-binding protein [Streptomyces sp. DSM 110735]
MRLRLQDVTKSFGENSVLRGVTFEVGPGEVVALAGENGAGKSTLTRVISGAHQPDAGQVVIDGEPVTFKNPQGAMARGIEVIYQEFRQNLFPHLSVAENIHVLDRERRFGRLLVSRKRMAEEARSTLAALGMDGIDVLAPVGTLGVAEQQMVEIAKATSHELRLLILDEPTAALDERESEQLFEQVRRLRDEGVSIVYISHRLDEIFELADRIVVLRDGLVALDTPIAETGPAQVVAAMVGNAVDDFYPKERNAREEVVLRVRGGSGTVFQGVDLDVRAGEVLGIGGVVGCGRSSLLRALFGLEPLASGTVEVDGAPVRLRNIRDAIAARIAYVTPDRQAEGLCPDLSVEANVSLATLRMHTGPGDLVRRTREREATGEVMSRLRVRTASPESAVTSLSGGNQQKALFAKWVLTGPRVLLMDEPTRGVDVGAKTEIYRIINQLTADGVAVVLVSSDLPELVAMSDRAVVMRQGRLVAEMAGDQLSEQSVLEHALVGAA